MHPAARRRCEVVSGILQGTATKRMGACGLARRVAAGSPRAAFASTSRCWWHPAEACFHLQLPGPPSVAGRPRLPKQCFGPRLPPRRRGCARPARTLPCGPRLARRLPAATDTQLSVGCTTRECVENTPLRDNANKLAKRQPAHRSRELDSCAPGAVCGPAFAQQPESIEPQT